MNVYILILLSILILFQSCTDVCGRRGGGRRSGSRSNGKGSTAKLDGTRRSSGASKLIFFSRNSKNRNENVASRNAGGAFSRKLTSKRHRLSFYPKFGSSNYNPTYQRGRLNQYVNELFGFYPHLQIILPQQRITKPNSERLSEQASADDLATIAVRPYVHHQISNVSQRQNNDEKTVEENDNTQEVLKFTSPLGHETFKHEIEELSEGLLMNDVNNAFKQKYMTMELQKEMNDDSERDSAFGNLLVASDILVWDMPTIKAALELHDNYELDATKNESVTEQQRDEENEFIDAVVNTDVMKMTKDFLVQKGYLPNDFYEFKNALRDMWFTRFQRVPNIFGSSAFEYVFLAERLDNKIIGLHNWIYYAKREADGQLNYLGYIGFVFLDDKGAFVKVRSYLNETISNATTFFVGLSPELEMSLYTLCFYISPWYPCPIKLAGFEFTIFTARYHYFGKDILVSADIEFAASPLSLSTSWNYSDEEEETYDWSLIYYFIPTALVVTFLLYIHNIGVPEIKIAFRCVCN